MNILDIVQVANAVLGGSLSGCGAEAADVNGDGALEAAAMRGGKKTFDMFNQGCVE